MHNSLVHTEEKSKRNHIYQKKSTNFSFHENINKINIHID